MGPTRYTGKELGLTPTTTSRRLKMEGSVNIVAKKVSPKYAVSAALARKAKGITLKLPVGSFFFNGCADAEQYEGQFPLKDGYCTSLVQRNIKHVSALVEAGLIQCLPAEGRGKWILSWLAFTDLGVEFAWHYGFDLTWIDPSMRGNYKAGDTTGFGRVKRIRSAAKACRKVGKKGGAK